jgi:hypothetical protein
MVSFDEITYAIFYYLLTLDIARRMDDDEEDNEPEPLNPFVQYTPDDTPLEYVPGGPRIPLSAFSVPFQESQPLDAVCAFCYDDFTETSDQAIVLARCRAAHPFHGECLDRSVNEGAMANSNRCPIDRDILCVGRSRIHFG